MRLAPDERPQALKAGHLMHMGGFRLQQPTCALFKMHDGPTVLTMNC